MTDKEIMTSLTAVFLPIVISFFQQPTFSDRARVLLAFLIIFLWTLAGAFFVNDATLPTAWDWRGVVRLLATNAIAAWAIYNNLLKPSGLGGKLEAMTSPPSAARDRLLSEAERHTQPPRTPETPR